MRHGLSVVTLGRYADPRPVVELALAAEEAGWDGLFGWDHLAFTWGLASADPWITLAAVAQATQRIRLGTAVTPLPRHRPWTFANTIATVDLLSAGRVTLGVGIGGVAREFTAFGETADAVFRAEQLDESLTVMSALWSGEAVQHQGRHYTVDDVRLAPVPCQRPRVPIWIGGQSPPALRRAARWDGWVGGADDEAGDMVMSAEEVAAIVRTIGRDGDFDIALSGGSRAEDTDLRARYAAAGVTWWLEAIHERRFTTHEEALARVTAGPGDAS